MDFYLPLRFIIRMCIKKKNQLNEKIFGEFDWGTKAKILGRKYYLLKKYKSKLLFSLLYA